mmetsp:Transcript_92033/g.274669  ORF Transcript_92033/g.274669 Transcript_92033/m.274669 type:complete len:203 (+) Transcript_92033:912-1520(+)
MIRKSTQGEGIQVEEVHSDQRGLSIAKGEGAWMCCTKQSGSTGCVPQAGPPLPMPLLEDINRGDSAPFPAPLPETTSCPLPACWAVWSSSPLTSVSELTGLQISVSTEEGQGLGASHSGSPSPSLLPPESESSGGLFPPIVLVDNVPLDRLWGEGVCAVGWHDLPNEPEQPEPSSRFSAAMVLLSWHLPSMGAAGEAAHPPP